MGLAEYINTHQGEFWMFVGFALIVLELWVLGFTSGVALFGAVGALLTGLLMQLGVLPQTWLVGIAGFGLLSAVSAAVLWRPLMWLQRDHKPPQRDLSSDLIGYRFQLGERIDGTTNSTTKYSGIAWQVQLDPAHGGIVLDAGSWVEVAAVDVGVFWVRPTQVGQ